MRIHCFQHVAFENLGAIASWAAQNNHSVTYTRFYENEPEFPKLTSFDFLIVLGGYMNVDEETQFPWLKEEKACIKKAIEAQKKVLGICLGSQLIASALGSKVMQNSEPEIGFFPLHFSDKALANGLFDHFKNPCEVFQWHGDTFEIPENALILASSAACKNQGFWIENQVLALQFHLEMTEELLHEMLKHDGHELIENRNYIQTKAEIIAKLSTLQSNTEDLFELLDKFIAS